MTKPLSPAAQAVLDAFDNASDGQYVDCVWVVNEPTLALAAALRAVADQVVPPEQQTPWGSVVQAHAAELRIRNELLAIADELSP
jgi:hypothetical protein